ncbi:MAG: glycosyltransferase [Crocosphaera sp.]|nr:glycosyltransferase [Crocosphaera sp.]
MMVTISIIVPAYNAEKTIIQTIKSVQAQTFLDWELLVIDDGSTDQTIAKVNSIIDKRINIFSYQNGGVAVARNRGLSLANGEFIAFLDADDLWTPDKLEKQLRELKNNPDAGVAYSWTIDFKDNVSNSFIPGKPIFFSGNVYTYLLVYNFLANGSNALIRRQAVESIGEFDQQCVPAEDWDFYLRLAKRWSFVVIPQHQILYRQSTKSASSNIKAMEKGALFTIQKAYDVAPTHLQSLKNQSLALLYEYCTQRYLQCSIDITGINEAAFKLWKAITLHPRIIGTKYFYGLLRGLCKNWLLMQVKTILN